jgi:hypothetical protein
VGGMGVEGHEFPHSLLSFSFVIFVPVFHSSFFEVIHFPFSFLTC